MVGVSSQRQGPESKLQNRLQEEENIECSQEKKKKASHVQEDMFNGCVFHQEKMEARKQ
jgi:hypothetical protein